MAGMSESESEDEILNRIEDALRKIASVTRNGKAALPVPHDPAPQDPAPQEEELDREALASALDQVILRLRGGLTPPQTPTEE